MGIGKMYYLLIRIVFKAISLLRFSLFLCEEIWELKKLRI